MSCLGILWTFIAQVFRSIKEWLYPETKEQFLSAQEEDIICQLAEDYELDANRSNSPVGAASTVHRETPHSQCFSTVPVKIERKTNGDYGTINLRHIMNVEVALDEALRHLKLAKQDKLKALGIVTGRGNKSKDHIPKIKPAVIALLEKEKAKNNRREEKLVSWFHEKNPGMQIAMIFKG